SGKPYALRRRTKVNYAIPPPLDDIPSAPPKSKAGGRGRGDWSRAGRKGPGWSASGAELGRFLGLPAEDSDSDAPGRAPRKGLGGPALAGGVGTGIAPADLATAAGGPFNLGKVGDADADPFGAASQNFDERDGNLARSEALSMTVSGRDIEQKSAGEVNVRHGRTVFVSDRPPQRATV
ncbi:hypothetical protein EWM64_g10841, partial [Hericium alpestre]